MWLYISGMILCSNYVVLNKKISDSKKTGFFIVALVLGVLGMIL